MPDAPTPDASTGGLIIDVVAKGGVPQMPTPNVAIEVLSIGTKMIRAIGDAAPGDMRTTRTTLEVFEWQKGLGAVPQLFDQAPPGVYSMVELRIGKLDITGRANRAGNLVPFEIKSEVADVGVNIAVNTVLAPRALATTAIDLAVAEIVEDVDWDSIPLTTEGRLFIGDGDPAMASVVANIATAFTAASN